MPSRVPERISPITPQLAWRVAVLGGMAFVLFGIVFFRLWFLQVLSGQQYVSQARENRVRKVPIEAARGDIVDRNGDTLVKTKQAAVVQILPNSLPDAVKTDADGYRKALAAAQHAMLSKRQQADAYQEQLNDDGKKETKAEKRKLRELKKAGRTAAQVPIPALQPPTTPLTKVEHRLARVLRGGLTAKEVHARIIRGIADAAYSNVTIQTDVDAAEFNYIKENQELFPGVTVDPQFLRNYPHDELGAQLFGQIGQVTAAQTAKGKYKGVAQGIQVGQSGLEDQYDKYLRGRNGYSRVVVNALGTRDDQARTSEKPAVEGNQLKLTLDYNLQKAGDDALSRGIAASQYGATAGAYVAMDPTTGAILAMGSQPGFDANIFAKPFSQKVWSFLTSDSTSAPLLDRAYESAYPTGSVFKPVTALAALQTGAISANKKVDDTGTWTYGGRKYQNAKKASFGEIDMSDAIKFSSDIYFFQLGAALNGYPAIQAEAKKLGFGRKTDLDLPGENPGLVPDSTWRNDAFAKYAACVDKNHLQAGTQPALFTCGGIERKWLGGDNVNLAVGQGDLQATPLQVAVAYSAIENGGTIVRPHLGSAIEDGYGRTVQELHYHSRRKVKIDPADRSVVLDGLHRATSEEGGTSADVFKNWDQKLYPVYGKTGTAERGLQPDQAWYACFVKVHNRPIVVVVTIEKGGFGAETAAPVARLILDQWFSTGDTQFHAGSSTTL
jgi:penicillin-binding protein 2